MSFYLFSWQIQNYAVTLLKIKVAQVIINFLLGLKLDLSRGREKRLKLDKVISSDFI